VRGQRRVWPARGRVQAGGRTRRAGV